MTKAYLTEIREARPGYIRETFVNVEFVHGEPRKGTAEKIVQSWYPTRGDAEKDNYTHA